MQQKFCIECNKEISYKKAQNVKYCDECRREINNQFAKQYYTKCKKEIKEYHLKYLELNKTVVKERRKKYYEKNYEKVQQDNKTYFQENKVKLKPRYMNRGFQKLYGISINERDLLIEQQGNVCRICKLDKSTCSPNKSLCVDHCHKTLKIRGIICDSCNRMLGFGKDNSNTFLAASEYIKTSQPSFSGLVSTLIPL